MSDQKLFPEKLPDCVEEPTKASFTPIAKAGGEIISDCLNLLGWPLTTLAKIASEKQQYIVSKQIAKQELKLAKFKDEVEEKLKKIPKDKLVPPDERIVCDVREKVQSVLDADDIRALYANLIANSANSDIASQVHPSFSTIISQLSSLDVQNLEIIGDGSLYPIANFIIFPNDVDHPGYQNLMTIHSDVFLSNPNNQDIFSQAVSLNSLARLQLITLDYTKEKSESASYDAIQAYFDELVKKECTPEFGAKIGKGIVHTTLLGRAFLAVCHSPFDEISETTVEP